VKIVINGVPRLAFIANKDINAGDELSYDVSFSSSSFFPPVIPFSYCLFTLIRNSTVIVPALQLFRGLRNKLFFVFYYACYITILYYLNENNSEFFYF
jgi:hypothetical protein